MNEGENTAALGEIIRIKEERLREIKAGADYSSRLGALRKEAEKAPPVRDFYGALKEKGGPEAIRIIAEIKKASPSKGVIREDFSPDLIALDYELGGAAAISVLTEEKFFLGSLTFLREVRDVAGLPVLRKDFLLDEYDILESRAAGADAVLLIAAILEEGRLRRLLELARELGMRALVEVHSEAELDTALRTGAEIIGINNRDLSTFRVDLDTTRRLAPLVPEGKVIVSESGIEGRADILSLKEVGVDAFLIGETLMREKDPAEKLRELIGGA